MLRAHCASSNISLPLLPTSCTAQLIAASSHQTSVICIVDIVVSIASISLVLHQIEIRILNYPINVAEETPTGLS